MKRILFALFCAACFVMLTGCNSRESLEKEAVSAINQIIRENPGKISGRCIRVELTEKLSDKKWKGTAFLDDDQKLTCYVTESISAIEVEVEYKEFVTVPVWTWE